MTKAVEFSGAEWTFSAQRSVDLICKSTKAKALSEWIKRSVLVILIHFPPFLLSLGIPGWFPLSKSHKLKRGWVGVCVNYSSTYASKISRRKSCVANNIA